MNSQALAWIGFNFFILIMLAVDLGFMHRQGRVIGFKEALLWSAFWIILALGFCAGLYFVQGYEPALDFLTGYLIEEALSVDNLFVFLLLFNYFQVPEQYQHRVLFWGIIGALLMRALFIFVGVSLVSTFYWLLYLFGAFLIFTGIKLAFSRGSEVHPENNPLFKLLKRWIPMTETYENGFFFVRRAKHYPEKDSEIGNFTRTSPEVKSAKATPDELNLNRFSDAGGFKFRGPRLSQNHIFEYLATPLFAVLIAVETADIIFAVDSIPAIMAITLDPFIIYTSNVFAILGLRSLFFVLSGSMSLFHHLHYGLAIILTFIGIKMVIADFFHIPIFFALAFILVVLVTTVLSSLLFPQKPDQKNLPN